MLLDITENVAKLAFENFFFFLIIFMYHDILIILAYFLDGTHDKYT